jgi:fructose-bisphosphate aldolase class II
MVLVSGAEVLRTARRKQFAVPQFNVLNLEMVDAVIRTAESLKSPVIVGLVDRHFPLLDVDALVYAVKRSARKAAVPVILHLDHGRTWDRVMEALRLGFTSVMFDGSLLPLEENARITGEIVRAAHAMGVSVEAELGHVGSRNEGDDNQYTSAEEAGYFVDRTNVDYLAVSIGNTHGHYRGEAPTFRMDVLRRIHDAVSVPLVLHGGSETPLSEIHDAISLGIAKINIFTEFAHAYLAGLSELAGQSRIDYLDIAAYGKRNAIAVIERKLTEFRSAWQCA